MLISCVEQDSRCLPTLHAFRAGWGQQTHACLVHDITHATPAPVPPSCLYGCSATMPADSRTYSTQQVVHTAAASSYKPHLLAVVQLLASTIDPGVKANQQCFFCCCQAVYCRLKPSSQLLQIVKGSSVTARQKEHQIKMIGCD